MEQRLSQEELQRRLDSANKQVAIGPLYKHYKGTLYKVIGIG